MINGIKVAPVTLALLSQFISYLPARAGTCGPQVRMSGTTATVLPSHHDDTTSFQCVFDALSGRPSTYVKLVAGEYTVGNLYINDFRGVLAGAGAAATTITNGTVNVSEDFLFEDPSPKHPWPSLLNFRGGRFEVRDIAIEIRGEAPVRAWTIPGFEGHFNAVAIAAFVLGKVDARFLRVAVSGQRDTTDLIFGYNLYNGIYFQSAATTASGTFMVHDSKFARLGSWVPLFGTADATVRVSANDVQDAVAAFDFGPLLRTDALYSDNRIRGSVFTSFVSDLDASSFALVGNNVRSENGIDVEMAFKHAASCSIVGNVLAVANDPAIHLGPGTSHCLVAGNHGATVVDEGTNNFVVRR